MTVFGPDAHCDIAVLQRVPAKETDIALPFLHGDPWEHHVSQKRDEIQHIVLKQTRVCIRLQINEA